jgi:Tfp pilus assembly protein PilF
MTPKRIIIAIVAAAGCGWGVWQSAASGFARTLGESALVTGQANAADEAVKLSPTDAETHCVRAVLLVQAESYAEAQLEVERAVQLRPRDYSTWLLLGITRDENHDQEGALRAFRQSTALAPAYAHPHWLLGNLLLRMGQIDQAFDELRAAASSNPELLPNVIDLAWGIYHGDASAVLAAVPPQTDTARLELAIFFARHQQSAAAADQFLAAKNTRSTKSEAVLAELWNARAFGDAYRVWARMHGVSSPDAVEIIRNAGFEDPITVSELGFGWQIATNVTSVTMTVDATEHQGGSKSLRIGFRGNSNPSQAVLTQLILVKPQTKYRLSFAAMGRDLVSAGLPIVTARDLSDPAPALLGQSAPLRSDVAGWREFSLDIMTGARTEAIVISVERQNCNADPCPAFGSLWLDSFSLEPR